MSIDYTFFKLNFGYYPLVSFKKDTNPYSGSKTANNCIIKLQKPLICSKNFYDI